MRPKADNYESINWESTWEALKKFQGNRCRSMKDSKALIFRVKCLNKILPTRDICYQRSPDLYQGRTCIACCVTEENFSHLAICVVYQRIWLRLEKTVIEKIALKTHQKWDIAVEKANLELVLLGTEMYERQKRRQLHLRGITKKKQYRELAKLVGSNSKARRILYWFIDLFWHNFYEGLWKFRCEVMAEWEKKKGISLREKRKIKRS